MARYTNVSTNFSGGLITDNLIGRTDLPRTANSCRKLTNFFPTLQGPAEYRPGFEVITVDSAYASESYVRQVNVVLATRKIYRCVFGNLFVKIYESETNELKDTVTTPYTTTDLKDLRFSSETDVLYVTHERHRPRKLTAAISFQFVNLRSLGFDDGGTPNDLSDDTINNPQTFDNLRCVDGPDHNQVDDDDTLPDQLRVQAPLAGDDNWSLDPIVTFVEPFLPKNTDDVQITATKSVEIVRLESPGAFSVIADDFASGTLSQTYYVQYVVDGVKILGKLIHASSASIAGTPYASQVQNPTADVVYVDAVDFVTQIQDTSALLQLIDNNHPTDDRTRYKRDGVPMGSIHLRADATVFDATQQGTWIQIDPSNHVKEDAYGATNTKVRWVKVKKFLGTEAHPVNYTTVAANATTSIELKAGHVYLDVGNGSYQVKTIGGNTTSNATVTTTAVITANGNRTFQWQGGTFTSSSGGGRILGDLTEAVAFAVHEIDTTTNGGRGLIKEYDPANGGSGELIIAPTGTGVELIANNAILTVKGTDASTFFRPEDLNRYIKLNFPSGVTYGKITTGVTSDTATVFLKNAVPRDKITGKFENDGNCLSFQMGAWFEGNFPRTTVASERRRVYGGTPSHPNFIFFSKIDDETDFAPTESDGLVLDTNGISYPLGNRNASIRWLVAAKDLVVGTTRGVFRVVPNQYEAAISPKTIRIELVDEVNCAEEAHMVGTSIFFPDKSATKLMEYKYDGQIQQSNANDLSKFIYPTFVSDTIVRIAVQANPQPRIWVLTTSGLLYVLTYHRAEDYYAWSKIDTVNPVTDIVCVKEGFESGSDKVIIASRENTSLQFESMFSQQGTTSEPTVFLDGAVRRTFTDVSIYLSGNDAGLPVAFGVETNYIPGQQVSVILNDQYYGEGEISHQPNLGGGTKIVVLTDYTGPTTGEVRMVVGKKYDGLLQPMYPTWDGANKPAFGADEIRVVSTKLHLINSSKFKIGVGGDFEQVVLPSSNYTGFDKERPLPGSTFGADRTPEIKQDDPSSLTITALITKTDLTG